MYRNGQNAETTAANNHRLLQKRYKRGEIIGRGNFGVVYKGVDLDTNKVVAIKVLNLDTVEDDVQDVQREINLLSQLKHADAENVTKYHLSFLKGPRLWIVMDYCAGGSVRTLMRTGKIEEKYIAVIMRETLIALQYIHKCGIIHRDVKAANILITNRGTVQLCDFGVAAQLTANKIKRSTFVGTPYWMAPEVITEGQTYNSKADIWSLGITVYEIVKGAPPFAELEAMRAIIMIPKEKPARLEGIQHSPAIKEFVALCLDEVPDARPSAEELQKTKFIKSSKGTPTSILKELVLKYLDWKSKGHIRDSVALLPEKKDKDDASDYKPMGAVPDSDNDSDDYDLDDEHNSLSWDFETDNTYLSLGQDQFNADEVLSSTTKADTPSPDGGATLQGPTLRSPLPPSASSSLNNLSENNIDDSNNNNSFSDNDTKHPLLELFNPTPEPITHNISLGISPNNIVPPVTTTTPSLSIPPYEAPSIYPRSRSNTVTRPGSPISIEIPSLESIDLNLVNKIPVSNNISTTISTSTPATNNGTAATPIATTTISTLSGSGGNSANSVSTPASAPPSTMNNPSSSINPKLSHNQMFSPSIPSSNPRKMSMANKGPTTTSSNIIDPRAKPSLQPTLSTSAIPTMPSSLNSASNPSLHLPSQFGMQQKSLGPQIKRSTSPKRSQSAVQSSSAPPLVPPSIIQPQSMGKTLSASSASGYEDSTNLKLSIPAQPPVLPQLQTQLPLLQPQQQQQFMHQTSQALAMAQQLQQQSLNTDQHYDTSKQVPPIITRAHTSNATSQSKPAVLTANPLPTPPSSASAFISSLELPQSQSSISRVGRPRDLKLPANPLHFTNNIPSSPAGSGIPSQLLNAQGQSLSQSQAESFTLSGNGSMGFPSSQTLHVMKSNANSSSVSPTFKPFPVQPSFSSTYSSGYHRSPLERTFPTLPKFNTEVLLDSTPRGKLVEELDKVLLGLTDALDLIQDGFNILIDSRAAHS